MRIFITSLLIFTCSISVLAQKIELYKSSYLPAQAYGGEEEIQDLVYQQINYPEREYNENIGGEVFVVFRVGAEGNFMKLEALGNANEELKKEAIRLTQLILWEKDPIREDQKVQDEKIKFTFSKKKYDKVVKKRGYGSIPSTPSAAFYPAKQLDSLPVLLDYKDINSFVRKNIKYPSLALQQGISGIVKVDFIIEPNGKVSNIRVKQAVAGGCNEETARLLKSMNWKAGIKDQKAVRTLYSYSLAFVHPGNTFR